MLKQADVLATEARLTDTPLFRSVKASVATRDNTVVAAVKPGLASNPENVKRVERLLPASQWEYLFRCATRPIPTPGCCKPWPSSPVCA
ncbi:hypothetical protein [Ideonella paludis]|uniref:hypothetical protein n=1 Tax=Ideonella paludis TaxID=1233411 RepID=UPI003629244B